METPFDEFDAEYYFLNPWIIVPKEEVEKNPECFRKPKIEESTTKKRNGMKTFDEFFNTDIFSDEYAEECKKKTEDVQKELNDQMKGKSHMTAAEARKKIHESLFGKDNSAGEELDFWDQPIEELEDELECEVKLEKTPDPVKEEIFATCLNFLHTHTEDELYEIVRLAFKAAEVFGY